MMMEFAQDSGGGDQLRRLVLSIISDYSDSAPRNQQQEAGPSEIGHPCDRRLVYQLARVPECGGGEIPWAAIVGTSIHAWMEQALARWSREHPKVPVETERELRIGPIVGHSDALIGDTVVDWKTASPDRLRLFRDNGPPDTYITQAHLYGYGYVAAGRTVRNVALVFLPRGGSLRSMHVWQEPYRPEVATAALARYERLRRRLGLSDVSDPGLWVRIPAAPGDHCGICSWYAPEGGAAGWSGCPGRM